MTVNELKNLNNLTTNNLQIGQILKIKENETDTNTYTVKSGDSLWSIANKYNTTANELKKLNNLTTNTLQIGQTIKVPQIAQIQKTYTVQMGDSLWSIARKNNTTVNELKSLNNLTTNTLQIGQTLKIPS